MDKKPHKESYYIEGLLKDDRKISKEIYDKYYARIERLVTSNSGNKDEALDVFQDALVVVYKNGLKPGFVLTSSFYSYLYGISRNLWKKELEKRKNGGKVTIQDEEEYKSDVDIEKAIHEAEKYELYKEKFALLGEKCQSIMKLVFQKKKMKEIAEKLGYNNDKTAKQQHYKCKQKLIKLIRDDSRFDDFKNG